MAEHVLRFARNMLLTRLLAPDDFGVMAVVLSTCSLFNVLTGLGIKEAVIQNPRGAEASYLNGAWCLAFIRGMCLYIAAFVVAPFMAQFYGTPELTTLLRVAFLSVVAQGGMSAGCYLAVKQMRYGRWVMVQQGGAVVGIATSVIFAVMGHGVWALVVGYSMEATARLVLSHLLLPFRVQLRFQNEHVWALLRFARGMLGLPFLTLIFTEGSVFVLGKLGQKHELGIYAVTLTLARIPTMFGNQMVELLMPAFSHVQGSHERINEGLLKVTTVLAWAALPGLLFVLCYGRELLSLLYGPQYAQGATALALLFATETLAACGIPLAAIYVAVGRPALLRRFCLIRAGVMVICIVPAVRNWGVAGAALVPLVAISAAYAFQLVRLRGLTGLDLRQYAGVFGRAILLSAPPAIVWLGATTFFHSNTADPARVIAGSVMYFMYLASLAVFARTAGFRQFAWPFGRAAYVDRL
jgi:O-antigen/teichoic acid export membrane protein